MIMILIFAVCFLDAKVQIPATWITCLRLAQEHRNWFWKPSFGISSWPTCRPKSPKSGSRYWGIPLSAGWWITLPPTIEVENDSWRGPLYNFHGHWRKAIAQTIFGGCLNVYTWTWDRVSRVGQFWSFWYHLICAVRMTLGGKSRWKLCLCVLVTPKCVCGWPPDHHLIQCAVEVAL